MTQRRWLSLGCVVVGALLAAQPAWAQLSLPPAGPSGGGFAGANSGGYGASVPLDFPAAHGGLPVPVQITYSEHGVGAAGRGWDVPLSYIRDDTTVIRRRPKGNANVAPESREQVSLVLSGRSTDLVPVTGGWIARNDDAQLQVRSQSDGTWVAYDGQGRTYTFAAISSALTGTGIWLLRDITAIGGGKVHLDYDITTPTVSGNAAITIDLTRVSYNPSPADATCYKNAVKLNYDAVVDPSLSISLIGSKILVRQHKLAPVQVGSAVDVLAKESCSASDVRLRRYQFTYAPDGDTGQPRLQQVQVFGRDGTTEANTAITVAKYSYGTATISGQLNYGSTVQRDTASSLGMALGSMQQRPAAVPNMGNGVGTLRQLVDVTGDGRPDVVEFTAQGQLNVYTNYSRTGAFGFRALRTLSDNTLLPREPDVRTTQTVNNGSTGIAYDRVWRQAIDVNGDGRVDIIDAAEQSGHWVVYLNTPDATDPAIVHWQRRSIPIAMLNQQLASRGMVENGFVPLSRTAIGDDGTRSSCWKWVQTGSKPSNGHWVDVTGSEPCDQPTLNFPADRSFTEWELKDINGDGYPDIVFNSSKTINSVTTITDGRRKTGTPDEVVLVVIAHNVRVQAGASNKLEAVLNVLGTSLVDGEVEALSSPVTLRLQDPCGVAQWASDYGTSQISTSRHMECGVVDVNGDGVVDRVVGTSVFLGAGRVDGNGFFTTAATMTLPGPLALEANDIFTTCENGGLAFTSQHKARLVDLTGDGIPDYVTSINFGTGWAMAPGTGTGFAAGVSLPTAFALSVNSDRCDATTTSSSAGLVDIDGDGRPELLNAQGQLLAVTGSDGIAGAPSAGRLVGIDNGFGAKTNIHYRSIKGDINAAHPIDPNSLHQVPFAEIVVDSVDTSATAGFGSGVGATRYAYGGAELVFDPARDRFTFPGYRRTITLQTPEAQPDGFGAIVISDSYAPVSAVDPYGIAGGATVDPDQRYALFRRIGRLRDVTVLSGNFGAAALADPSQLLGIDVTTDVFRIGAAHYEWSARRLTSASDLPGPEACTEAIFPYDYAGSTTFAVGHDHFDPCIAHGFAFSSSVDSWRGDPGAAPSSPANVETRTDVLAVDDFGRVTSVRQSNDVHRTDDDLCVKREFTQPAQDSYPRMLTAVASRTVLQPDPSHPSDCSGTVLTLAKDTFGYDGFPAGSVSQPSVLLGHVTSHDVQRYDDTGAQLGTDPIHKFVATWNPDGNPATVTTTREDGASRTVTITHDVFELAVTDLKTSATGLPDTTVHFDRDKLSLNVTSTTDPNLTKRGARYDGFDRQTMSTITPPGGTEGALWFTSLDFHGTGFT